MSDINAEVAEWVVSFWKKADETPTEIVEKGGPGSGEQDGHPFRGNRYTGGVQSAGHHNVRPGTERYSHGQHMTAAGAHISAARSAINQGEHGIAMKHFNEAAYHAAQASKKLQEPGGFTNHELGQQAEALYHAAHHAGDAAERASKATNDAREGLRSGVDSTTQGLLSAQAANARAMAENTARAAENAHDTAQTSRRLVGDTTLPEQFLPAASGR